MGLVQSLGRRPVVMDILKSFVRGSAIRCAPSLSSFPGMLSGPGDLDGSTLQMSLHTSSMLNLILQISSRLLGETVGMALDVDCKH